MTREERLVQIARRSVRWFTNRIEGTGRNGPHDDILIARELLEALSCYDDIEPQHDLDRQKVGAA